jgi:diadenylate cyclase
MQLNELVKSVEQDEIFLIRDYCQHNLDYSELYKQIQGITSEELLELDVLARIIGYVGLPLVDTLISPRGYRMLNKIPRIPASVIENLIKRFKELKGVMEASYEQLDKVEGIGEARAKAIKSGLRRLREQIMVDKLI